jgi:hypothetical protein
MICILIMFHRSGKRKLLHGLMCRYAAPNIGIGTADCKLQLAPAMSKLDCLGLCAAKKEKHSKLMYQRNNTTINGEDAILGQAM